MSKPRSDSILKSRAEQSEEFGEKLWEWCHEPKTKTCPGGLKHAREQLAADGVTLGGGWLRQLSEFCSWWELKVDTAAADQAATDIEDLLRKNPSFTAQQIETAGQLVFTQRAFAARNSEEFREMNYLQLAKETARTKGELEKAKLELRKIAEERKQGDSLLAKQKYQRDTVKLYIKWYANEEAKKIMTGGGTNAQQIELLGRAMFGEDWDE